MRVPRPVVVDFETHGIEARPAYPPLPVGVAVKWPGKPGRYYGFGHPEGNNSSWDDARQALAKAWEHPGGLLFHNAKFDLDVATTHMGLPMPPWQSVHDTMFLLFLDDPHQPDLQLKSAASRLLGLPPEEQDVVSQWLLDNQPVLGVRISGAKGSVHAAGRYLAYAPADLVGTYAIGDVARTEQLFQLLWPRVAARNMLSAYDRERQLVPILLEMERRGLPVDLPLLAQDVATYRHWHGVVTQWLLDALQTDANLDSGEQLVAALVAADKLDITKLPLTATGKHQTNKEALTAAVTDPTVLAMLTYRTQLSTCLRTFMEPWLATATATNGLIYTTWNQVRGAEGGGTRTGRLSSTPNFQNMPNAFKPLFKHEKDGLPACPLPDLPPLPLVRRYVAARPKHVLLGRDFASQELRILAHFEDGQMAASYVADPTIDFHQRAADVISQTTGVEVTRKATKNIAFSILYGSGIAKLAEGLGCSMDEARRLRETYLSMFPGIKHLQTDLKQRAALDMPLRTWGGREYYCEPPKVIDGQYRTFDYKLLNYLIQASAADQTKEAIIKFYNMHTAGQLLLTAHDEILVEAPRAKAKAVMAALKQAMDDAGLDVPMISDGEMGPTWMAMESCT